MAGGLLRQGAVKKQAASPNPRHPAAGWAGGHTVTADALSFPSRSTLACRKAAALLSPPPPAPRVKLPPPLSCHSAQQWCTSHCYYSDLFSVHLGVPQCCRKQEANCLGKKHGHVRAEPRRCHPLSLRPRRPHPALPSLWPAPDSALNQVCSSLNLPPPPHPLGGDVPP